MLENATPKSKQENKSKYEKARKDEHDLEKPHREMPSHPEK